MGKTLNLTETGPGYRAEIGDLFPKDVADGITAVRQRGTSPNTKETENWPLGTEEYADFIGGRNYVVVYGMVSYDDIFHVRHWTRYCSHHNIPTGAPRAANCAAYNLEDDNEEP